MNKKVIIAIGVAVVIVLVLCVLAAQTGLDLRELMLRAHGLRR